MTSMVSLALTVGWAAHRSRLSAQPTVQHSQFLSTWNFLLDFVEEARGIRLRVALPLWSCQEGGNDIAERIGSDIVPPLYYASFLPSEMLDTPFWASTQCRLYGGMETRRYSFSLLLPNLKPMKKCCPLWCEARQPGKGITDHKLM